METRVAIPAAKSIKSAAHRIDSNQKPASEFGPKLEPRSCSEPSHRGGGGRTYDADAGSATKVAWRMAAEAHDVGPCDGAG
jgi:hypothetical protein